MVMSIVYVLKKDNDWWSRNCYDAAKGFADRGFEVRGFEIEQLKDLLLNKETVVYGHIQAVKQALAQIGVEPPKEVSIPDSLKSYTKRNVWFTTLGEVKALDFERKPVFIKPSKLQKIFTGFVLNSYRALEKVHGLPDDFELLASDVVQFKSEWRFYVLAKEIVGVGHYHGDPTWFPNPTVAQFIIEDWAEQPIAYSIDLGALGQDRYSMDTALVEVNDSFALGNYGIPSVVYAKMIEARWFEMVGMKEQWLVF